MLKHRVTWIVIADSSRAQIVTQREDHSGFDIVTALQSSNAHASSHELGADRPGRMQESANPAHHSIQPRTDPHEESSLEFLEMVANYLNEKATQKEVHDLILFAPPRALGHLRKMLSAAVEQKIRVAQPKDLTHVPFADLPKHLEALP